MTKCFDEKDLPGSYHDADCESIAAQRKYIAIFRVMLWASVLAATFTWLADVWPTHRQLLNSLALILGVSAFISTFVLKERKFEDTWYLGRAVAESIKTRSWRFMMGAEPYGIELAADEADKLFIGDVARILADNGGLTLQRAPGKTRDEISASMRALRASSLAGRMNAYLECRIYDQRDWYGAKASLHAGSESKLFVAVLLCQFAASVVAFYGIVRDSSIGGSAAVLAALGTAFVAWLQVKKYQETAKAYAVASHDLSMAAALVGAINTEEQASRFVKESESAISREHTLWMARRNAQA